MILRSMASSQSNVIETIILFLAVALALYYLIDYFLGYIEKDKDTFLSSNNR